MAKSVTYKIVDIYYEKFIIVNPITSQRVTYINAPDHGEFSPFSYTYALFDDMKQTLKLISYDAHRDDIRFYVFLSETCMGMEKQYSSKKNSVQQLKIQTGFRFPNILWGSEGVLYACKCDIDGQGFEIISFSDLDLKWSNIVDGIEPIVMGHFMFKQWVPISPIKKLLAEKKQKEKLKYGNIWPKPVSFNEDLQKLYLQSLDSLFAYSLETQKFSIVNCC
ncbi:hypothetical protein ACFE04_002511 [Oxalis oulophora]